MGQEPDAAGVARRQHFNFRLVDVRVKLRFRQPAIALQQLLPDIDGYFEGFYILDASRDQQQRTEQRFLYVIWLHFATKVSPHLTPRRRIRINRRFGWRFTAAAERGLKKRRNRRGDWRRVASYFVRFATSILFTTCLTPSTLATISCANCL